MMQQQIGVQLLSCMQPLGYKPTSPTVGSDTTLFLEDTLTTALFEYSHPRQSFSALEVDELGMHSLHAMHTRAAHIS